MIIVKESAHVLINNSHNLSKILLYIDIHIGLFSMTMLGHFHSILL
jgi:hypothetical protein